MKFKHILFGFVLLMAIPLAWYAGRQQGRRHSDTPNNATVQSDITAMDDTSQSDLPKASPEEKPITMRQRVAKVIETDVVPLREVAAVDAYLASLKQQAQQKRQVTALEVETGIQAIMNLAPVLGQEETTSKADAYATEMAKMSREFGNIPESLPPPTAAEVDAMLDDIANDEENASKQKTIRKFMESIQNIEDMNAQNKAMARLNALVGAEREKQVPADMAALESDIVNAKDNAEKQTAISAYLEGAQTLEPEQQSAAMMRLNELANN
ncbi:MAG: hypothetical protein JXR76_17510 [Deltaproteobacteria bacterium]|nr:hypothetical protein [Deltaproteobacteria bacterium]